MSFILSKIKGEDRDAAKVLEEAGLRTNSEILKLTREDLHELFPGRKAFKLRRSLYDIIHERPIAEQVLKNLKGFLPRDTIRAALTNNGVLVDYLQILKDTKTQVNSIQSFLDAHIGLLGEFSTDQPDSGQTDGCSQEAGDAFGPNIKQSAPPGPQEQQKDRSGPSGNPVEPHGDKRDDVQQDTGGEPFEELSLPDVMEQDRSGPSGYPVEPHGGKRDDVQQDTGGEDYEMMPVPDVMEQDRSGPSGYPVKPHDGKRDGVQHDTGEDRSGPSGYPVQPHGGKRGGVQHDTGATLLYKMVVGGGKTFGTDRTLMEKVEKPYHKRLRPCGAQDNNITFVFCPISSRVETDVDAAMVDIKDDKPIVLVLMHHTYEVKPVSSMKIKPDDARVVSRVNVFYHETCGLLKCDQNDAAVTEIQKKLEESF